MPVDADISVVAALFAERARADMALVLLDGRALTAGELARTAGLTAPAASPHLARLVEGGALTVQRQGRHRYYQLATPAIARVLEVLLTVAPSRPVSTLRDAQRRNVLWAARTCYDHLAGALAVDLFDRLVQTGMLVEDTNIVTVSPAGVTFIHGLGIDLEKLHLGRRPVARPCLDWTERRHHLAGALGAALLDLLMVNGTIERRQTTRAVRVTEHGSKFLDEVFDVQLRATPGTIQPSE
ncbi:MAG: ArsR/SmtB family transcription factor [Acidimicrobiales bacterium]